jgi:predicted nucleic acid-binding protein
VRSLFMHLAAGGLFHPRWTDAIHEEWIRSLLAARPDVTRQKAERVRELMNAHVLDAQVTGYEDLIPTLELPDPDDRHVLAAAVRCGATGIVTFNLSDFPQETLTPHNVEAVHPDEFVVRLLDRNTAAVCAACARHRATLKNPPKSVEEFLSILERAGLTQTVTILRPLSETL